MSHDCNIVDAQEVALSTVVVECYVYVLSLVLSKVYFVMSPFVETLFVGAENGLLRKVGRIVAGCRDEHTVSG